MGTGTIKTVIVLGLLGGAFAAYAAAERGETRRRVDQARRRRRARAA